MVFAEQWMVDSLEESEPAQLENEVRTSPIKVKAIILQCFLGAVERQKLVYIMNRDASANLTISSPLEAHKAHCICYSVVGVDVGFENPTFACLEVDYEVWFLYFDYERSF